MLGLRHCISAPVIESRKNGSEADILCCIISYDPLRGTGSPDDRHDRLDVKICASALGKEEMPLATFCRLLLLKLA